MNFLFTIDNGYIEPIKTLLFSIFVNMGEGQNFYFIYQNILLEKREEIIEFAETKCKSEAIFVEYKNDMLNHLPVLGTWSKEIYLRLFAPFVLENIDRILYLDGDTIVNGDLTEIFNLEDFEDFMFAAVPNDIQDSHKVRLGLEEKNVYINSGVLLMNLEKLRQQISPEEVIRLLFEFKDKLLFPDQDFINLVFKDNIKILDIEYNYMINLIERVTTYPKLNQFKICHYVLSKPWNVEFPYKTDYIFFKYLLKRKQFRDVFYLWYKHRKVRMVYKINNARKR